MQANSSLDTKDSSASGDVFADDVSEIKRLAKLKSMLKPAQLLDSEVYETIE